VAALGDLSVVTWADNVINTILVRQDLTRALALEVIAISPLPDAEKYVREILLKNDSEDLEVIVEAYLEFEKWEQTGIRPGFESRGHQGRPPHQAAIATDGKRR